MRDEFIACNCQVTASLQHRHFRVFTRFGIARRQVSPLKNKISAFVEPVPKEPIEV
jgi:hypothetical protein